MSERTWIYYPQMALPSEPLRESVILDRTHTPWLRGPMGWERADVEMTTAHSWKWLLEHYGPVFIVYTPTETP